MSGASAHGRPAIAVHGGAGVLAPGQLLPEREAQYRAGLTAAVMAGRDVLVAGGSALDAVVAAVRVLEESEHFNAGRGAVLNADGEVELDAAVMDGATRRAGAVAAVRTVRNPVVLARAVMEHTPCVLLAAAGAERLATELGLETVPNTWFVTERRLADLAKAEGQVQPQEPIAPDDGKGTVGAVAVDREGRTAAATSTGGLTAKRPGRVGDTPVIGGGTWADDRVAVSATGHGEAFIRAAAAHRLAALVELAGLSLDDAAARVLEDVRRLGGDGGLIAVTTDGELALPFITPGMSRGWWRDGREVVAAVYPDR